MQAVLCNNLSHNIAYGAKTKQILPFCEITVYGAVQQSKLKL